MYIGMGGTYESFWHMNPRKLEVFYNGFRELQKRKADEMYTQAEYTFIALSVALVNMFRKKHEKPLTFRDAVEKPEIQEDKPLTDEQVRLYREAFFMGLKIRQANFELTHGGKK